MVIKTYKREQMPELQSPSPFAHWMLREIHEQPETLAATLDRYVDGDAFRDDLCAPIRQWLKNAKGEIVIAASGSSRHAGLVAELVIEDLSSVHVDVEYASEYAYSSGKSRRDGSVMVISQSGETADTLAALRKAKAAGHETLAITNVATSTMAKEATVSFPTEAGRERAIPATKSFTAQLLNLYLLALLSAENQGKLTGEQLKARLVELSGVSAKVKAQLPEWETAVREVAEKYRTAKNFLFLGRSVHNPIAREGALKLKESAYLHAEGYPSGELKHGPNALVSEGTPLVMIATVDTSDPDSVVRYEKVLQLLRDMNEQGANIFAVANTGDTLVAELATNVIFVDEACEALLPIFEIIPLQLFSYFMAINNGIDVDNPRNLTKAVLVD
jgi:glucosamine--fructose-6-phosphate aminotransferase (isomerizing)